MKDLLKFRKIISKSKYLIPAFQKDSKHLFPETLATKVFMTENNHNLGILPQH